MLSTRNNNSAASEAELTTALLSLYASTTPSSAMLLILFSNRSKPELAMPLLMACRRRATRSELSRPALSARMVGSCRSARAKASTAGPRLEILYNRELTEHTKLFLSCRVLSSLLNSQAHGHLSTSTTKSNLGLFDSLGKNGKSIVKRTFCFIKELFGRSTQNNGASYNLSADCFKF